MSDKKLKILFISERLYPTKTATSICTLNVIEELVSKGHLITYIAVNQDQKISEDIKELEEVDFYEVKSTKFGYLSEKKKEGNLTFHEQIKFLYYRFIRKIKNALHIYSFPDVDLLQSKDVYDLAKRLHEITTFDCAIGVFRPFSTVSGVIQLKKNFPNVIVGAYYLDLIFGANKPSLIPQKLYNKITYEGELNSFETLDFILMAQGGKSIYSEQKYKKVNSKIEFIDFPLFKYTGSQNLKNRRISGIEMIYAGTLDLEFRNPEYALKILSDASETINNMRLRIYGRSDCDGIINKYTGVDNIEIINNGMVNKEVVNKSIYESNILINISNKSLNMVPSKIFELFSTGIPIINFVSNPDDISIEYFKNYPAACIIKQWEDYEMNLDKIISFIKKESNNIYDISKIKDKFEQNTPKFTADLIERKIQETKPIN